MIRSRLQIIVFVCLTFVVSKADTASGASGQIEIWDLVGDPLVSAEDVHSLMNLVLTTDVFSRIHDSSTKSEIGGIGVNYIANHFHPGFESTGEGYHLDVSIEVVTYDYVLNLDNRNFIETWAFGLLGILINNVENSEVVSGRIIARYLLTTPNGGCSVSSVVESVVTGDIDRLSREAALSLAADRLVWDLGFSLNDKLRSECGQALGREFKKHDPSEYGLYVDHWRQRLTQPDHK